MSRSHAARRWWLTLVPAGLLAASLAMAQPAGALMVPVPPGQTWVVCQGYGSPDPYALELSADVDGAGPAGCQGDPAATAGREVLAPGSGTVSWSDGNAVCIDLDGGGSVLLGNVAGPPAATRAVAGSTIGAVRAAAAGTVATLRLAADEGPGCTGRAPVPFTEAAGTRLTCAADLPASGVPNEWSGVRVEACTQPAASHGDFDGDGRNDIAALTAHDGAETKLWVFRSLGGGGFAAPVPVWSGGAGAWEWTRIKPLAGDFDGDGRSDVALFYGADTEHTQLWVLRSTGAGFAAPVLVWDSGPGAWEWARMKPVVGDFNLDELSDLAVLYGHDGGQAKLWRFEAVGGGRFGAPGVVWDSGPGAWDWARSKAVASDVDGDDRDDIAVFYGLDAGQTKLWVLRALRAGGFAPPALGWDSGVGVWDAARARPVAGDFDGDGRNEIGAFYARSGDRTQLWTFRGGRGTAVSPALAWDSGPGNWHSGRAKPVAGDFAGDESDDVAALYEEPGARTTLRTLLTGANGFVAPALVWDSGVGLWDWARALPL